MKINTRALGISSATIAAASYVVCGLFVVAAPGATSRFFGWIFHIDLSSMARQISITSFIGGLILFSAFVGTCVAATAGMYNRLNPSTMNTTG